MAEEGCPVLRERRLPQATLADSNEAGRGLGKGKRGIVDRHPPLLVFQALPALEEFGGQ
jgi:hypothetical protein